MESIKQNYFFINNEKNIFTFNLDIKNNLSYKMYNGLLKLMDENTLRERDVLLYSTTLDDKGNINVLYLVNSGVLHLITYDNMAWSNFIIGEFDLESNKYYQLELFFLNGKFHIMYGYSNLINPNICTIQHIIYKDNIEQRHNVIKYVSVNKRPYFSIDYDKSATIHLLYNTVTNSKSYIYHCFYSPYRKSWSNNPKALWEGVESGFTYIYVDSMDSIYSLWLEKSNSKYKLSCKKMNTKGKDKYVWTVLNLNDIFLSKNNFFTLHEKDKTLYLSYVETDIVKSLKSRDYGNSWVKDIDFKYNNISRIKVVINKDIDLNLKINHMLNDFKDMNNSKLLKILFPNNIDSYEEGESSFVNYNNNSITQKSSVSSEDKNEIEKLIKDLFIYNQPNPEETMEDLKLEMDKIKIEIQKVQDSYATLLEGLEKSLNREDYYTSEISLLKNEIKEIKTPIIRKIFG